MTASFLSFSGIRIKYESTNIVWDFNPIGPRLLSNCFCYLALEVLRYVQLFGRFIWRVSIWG